MPFLLFSWPRKRILQYCNRLFRYLASIRLRVSVLVEGVLRPTRVPSHPSEDRRVDPSGWDLEEVIPGTFFEFLPMLLFLPYPNPPNSFLKGLMAASSFPRFMI